ncbi:amidase [Granulicella tundricola]|uniref:Amidase n=1 Tax=Granulicella tundricola (strain ATCC BAA-1859 / DSM 23138 / MP5ACTX9) TaxID=1198114 RepID=E8WZA9_GRATM|nr:amidase [Granulicella tundricola]ADW67711.1 Amidase [Granulicella tundricola MP5ACTX9]
MPTSTDATRRRFLAVCATAGLGHTVFPGALLALATTQLAPDAAPSLPKITAAMIDNAAAIAGITIDEPLKAAMLDGLNAQRDDVQEIRKLPLPNSVAPAMVFDPVPGGMVLDTTKQPLRMSSAPDLTALTAKLTQQNPDAAAETLAFATVRELAELLRTKRVTPTTLTRMYLARLKRLDSRLHFVITLTEERALKQAAQADQEIAAGHYRGPLHGIPWGGKDLLAVKGYPTTWGAAGFEHQTFDEDAEVVKRLDAAGAILIAKLSMGALAQGDLWFGGRTRNPWNPRQGSSGSSAGSASATSAGCVAFAIGTETLGSISSPSTRCGVTGLRPTYGFVPRTGAMALSWSMDKIGPICRSVEDCALVLSVITGPDGHDLAVKPAAFNWDAEFDWRKLRVGFIKSAFDAPTMPELKAPTAGGDTEMEAYKKRVTRMQANLVRTTYDAQFNQAALSQLTKMGVHMVPVEMPKLPFAAMVPVLEAEGAAAFDELTRSGRDKLLTGQQPFDWPNNFRVARFYSAVDYIQAMRARTLAIKAMAELFTQVDVIVTPSQGIQLTATNLTGYPAVIVPNGLRGTDAPPSPNDADGALDNTGGPGTPVSLTFLGNLYSDARLAAFARAYQQATGFHKQHPQLG